MHDFSQSSDEGDASMTTTATRLPARECLTAWYPVDTYPVHIGVYQTHLGPTAYNPYGFSYWDGNHWSNQYLTPERAEQMGDNPGAQDKRWRGLKEQS